MWNNKLHHEFDCNLIKLLSLSQPIMRLFKLIWLPTLNLVKKIKNQGVPNKPKLFLSQPYKPCPPLQHKPIVQDDNLTGRHPNTKTASQEEDLTISWKDTGRQPHKKSTSQNKTFKEDNL